MADSYNPERESVVRLAAMFKNEMVRVYLSNGAILSGVLKELDANDAIIENTNSNKHAVVNLNQVISISKY